MDERERQVQGYADLLPRAVPPPGGWEAQPARVSAPPFDARTAAFRFYATTYFLFVALVVVYVVTSLAGCHARDEQTRTIADGVVTAVEKGRGYHAWCVTLGAAGKFEMDFQGPRLPAIGDRMRVTQTTWYAPDGRRLQSNGIQWCPPPRRTEAF